MEVRQVRELRWTRGGGGGRQSEKRESRERNRYASFRFLLPTGIGDSLARSLALVLGSEGEDRKGKKR